jgi:hypothetical protein
MVFVPCGCLKPLTTSVANSGIGEEVIVVVGDQRIGKQHPERMLWGRAENVIAQGATTPIRNPRRVVKKGFEVVKTALENGSSATDTRRGRLERRASGHETELTLSRSR